MEACAPFCTRFTHACGKGLVEYNYGNGLGAGQQRVHSVTYKQPRARSFHSFAMADVSNPAAAAAATKPKRAGRPPKRAADAISTDAAVAAAAPAAAAPPAAPAKTRKPKAAKATTAAVPPAAGAAVPPAAAAVSVDATGGAGADTDAPKKKVTPTYIINYGDNDKTLEEQLAAITLEDFYTYRTAYYEKLNKQTFAQWAKEKKAYINAAIKKENAASKRTKRAKKTVDWAAKYEDTKTKLAALNPSVFAALNGKWITDFGNFGLLDASALSGKTPLELPSKALYAATVYELALKNGATPAGIVDCSRKMQLGTKKADNLFDFRTACPGPRLFVGEIPKYYPAPIPGIEEYAELSSSILKKKPVVTTA